MSKYELQKIFFQKIEKTIDDVIFSVSVLVLVWTLPVSVSKPKLRSRPVLVSAKFCGLGLGLGRVGLDNSPGYYPPLFGISGWGKYGSHCWVHMCAVISLYPTLYPVYLKLTRERTRVFLVCFNYYWSWHEFERDIWG